MKKTFLLIVGLLVAASLVAQVHTVISGKVLNKPDKLVILLIYNFNTGTMTEEETTIQTPINSDSTFSISTDKIIRPFTSCRLGFNNEGQKILLSPGDSVRTEFQYGTMETSTVFTDKGAGKNNYLQQYQLRFSDNRKKDIYQNTSFRDSSLINSLTNWRNEKIGFLNSSYYQYLLDTIFYQQELSRINYEYYNDLINPNIRVFGVDSESAYNDRVAEILGRRNFSDDDGLVNFKEYRLFIKDYIDYRAEMIAGKGVNLQDRLECVSSELTGLPKTYCAYLLIEKVISAGSDSQKKLVLKNYFVNNTLDNNLVRLLESIDISPTNKNTLDYYMILTIVRNFLVSIFFIALLLLILYQVRLYLLKKGKHLNPMVITKGVIYLLILFTIIGYLGNDVKAGNRILPILRVLTLISFAGVQIYWLIPFWFRKDRYLRYSLFLFLISSVYFFLLILLGHAEYLAHPRFQWLESDSILFIVNSWIILVPFSFLNYYINLLIRKRKGFDYLLKEKFVSIESVLHVVFLMIILSAYFTDSFRHPGRLTEIIVFILGIFIFYFQTFFLIPRYLLLKKIGIYLLGCLAVLTGSAIIIYFRNILELFISISSIGIKIPFLHLLGFPEQIQLITAVAMQLLIIPSMIYAFVRYQITQKSVGFKLFRNKEAELNQLRAQVNPHFLFNSLNTLYAFALKENNPKTAEYIAKLANLMRYLVDDMEKEKIPVQKEISYIRDYVNLQAIRSSAEHKIDINIGIDEDQNIMIAPMLMIPFVENAFKHGINPNSESELKVTIQIKEDRFQFVIENSVDKNFESFYKEKGFGIGIPNVRQRLEFIYPGKHTLSVADTGNRFIIILTIELNSLTN